MSAPRHFHQAVAAAKAGIRKGDSVTRPTADIVADLRGNPDWTRGSLVLEAADRLTELDAQLAAVGAALDQYAADATQPGYIEQHEVTKFWSAVAKAVGR